MPAYAERLGVSAWTLYQWRRRLAESPDDRAKLIEVAVAGPSDPASTSPLVVRVNDGRRAIEVPREFDPNELRRLLAALESC